MKFDFSPVCAILYGKLLYFFDNFITMKPFLVRYKVNLKVEK